MRAVQKQVHPDLVGRTEGNQRASAATALVNEAYAVLTDPTGRAAFDADREEWLRVGVNGLDIYEVRRCKLTLA